MQTTEDILEGLVENLNFDAFLRTLETTIGPYEMVTHWQQGEFHHDFVLRVREHGDKLPSPWLVAVTNCNGGIKEILCVREQPERWGLWKMRVPEEPEFEGPPPELLASIRTVHWYDPRDFLRIDARSELKEEHRKRQRGGGWVPLSSTEELSSVQPK
jgi:hypothetical protein